jgi:hypothetical protein
MDLLLEKGKNTIATGLSRYLVEPCRFGKRARRFQITNRVI